MKSWLVVSQDGAEKRAATCPRATTRQGEKAEWPQQAVHQPRHPHCWACLVLARAPHCQARQSCSAKSSVPSPGSRAGNGP